LIKGKDVLLMIGNTGSGKSTIILKFLGNNFKKILIGNAVYYVPDDNLNPLHKSFHTSPECVSCTSFINAAPIPEDMKT
jgi:GTPase SAR1 family protein